MGLPAKYGGFETFVHFLVLHLGTYFDFNVHCSGPDYQDHPKSFLNAKLTYFPVHANGPQSVLFDTLGILHACLFSDVLLVLGASGGLMLPIAHFFGKRVVHNPGGIEWQRSKWGPKTQRFLKILERYALKGTDVLVCDNQGILDYFRKTYGREGNLIEYGGDHISKPELTDDFRNKYPYVASPYAFSVARIQPDNNIEMILEAYRNTPEHQLIFVGNWAGSAFGKEIKQRFASYNNIHLLEAIYDQDILNRFRAYCSIYLHGHSAGGTNPALVEAMHLGLPIAAFDVIFNHATSENKALYFKDAEELATLIQTTPMDTWTAQGAAMKEIANRRYTWSLIAAKYAELF